MQKRDVITTAVVILGIAVTAVAGWLSYRSFRIADSTQTAFKADNAASAAKLALDRVALSVRAVRAMYAADWVTPDQFERFARTLTRSEGIRSLEFDRRVQLDGRAAYEASLPAVDGERLGIWERGPDGKPVRAPDRPVYFVLEAAHYSDGTTPAIGLDVSAIEPRATAIKQAIASFDLLVSAPVAFGPDESTGVFLIAPAIDRAGTIAGVATGTITFGELADVAARASGAQGVTIAVGVDAPDSLPQAGEIDNPGNIATPNKRSFDFGGQTWTVSVPQGGGGQLGAWVAILIVGAGLATTAAIAAYIAGLRKTAEIAEARAELRRMLDGLGPLAWLLKPDGEVVHANRAASAALGRPEGEIVGQPFWNLPLDGGDSDASLQRIRSAVMRAAGGEDSRFDLTLTEDDEDRVFDLWIRPLGSGREGRGNLVASAVDITDRYEGEQTQRMLMRELDHRMKNTLQVIQAVIRRTARAQSSVPMFERSLLGRVGAMSRAHDLLAEERWLGAELSTVVTREVGSFDTGGAIRVEGPRLRLNPRAALSIALAIHELGTNASKYGALSAPDGKVSVTWQILRASGGPQMTLRWEETGGPEVEKPTGKGFGSTLIERSIAYELEGEAELEYRREGVVCVITIPLRMLRPFVDERLNDVVG